MTREEVEEIIKARRKQLGMSEPVPVIIYPAGTILRSKKNGKRVKILKPVYLSDNETNFLHYDIRIEGKKGMYVYYPDDLEEIK